METYGYNEPNNDAEESRNYSHARDKKIAAALLGIFLGSVGANKFYLGYIKEAIIQIVLNLVTCGIASVIPFVEGIIYLTMSDRDFEETYIYKKRAWL